MSEEQDWNQQIINEFRANGGKVGGPFDGAPLLLLHHVGARSGDARVTPVMYQDIGGSYAVFGSNAGRDGHPAWYHNLRAHPQVNIEVGTNTVQVTARVAGDAERAPIWATQKRDYPAFADYERGTDRQIPVVVLDPVG